MNWSERASAVKWNIGPFIDGRYVTSTSTEYFEAINPATELTLCSVPTGSAADVDAAIRVARKRFDQGCWSEMPAGRRCEVLLRLAELIVAHKDRLALLDTLEMGKPITAALFDAEQLAPRLLRSWAGYADKLLGSTAPMGSASALSFNSYEPRGVVAAITSWNFPAVNAVYKIGPALAAGNTVVLKPSELSPSSALKLAELALEAGVPEGVFNVVPGLGSTVGVALASHADVNLLTFTGSTVTGRKIVELSCRTIGKPLLLECGGKSPQVVFEDSADLDAVTEATVQSALRNQGQVCGAHTRLIAHETIKDALLEKVAVRAGQYRPGDPLDESTNFGPLASRAQRERVRAYVEGGLQAGAVAVLKGEIRERGGFYAPR